MKSKAHGKKCQAMGVSESSPDDPESEETGTGEWAGQTVHISAPSCTVENIGAQLDELPVKAWSCSVLAAYATLCSILLPSALHKKCEKVINKKHGAFDSFLQECALHSRVRSLSYFLLFEASYLTGFSPTFPFGSQT